MTDLKINSPQYSNISTFIRKNRIQITVLVISYQQCTFCV